LLACGRQLAGYQTLLTLLQYCQQNISQWESIHLREGGIDFCPIWAKPSCHSPSIVSG
jgi:hypothetical protein